MSKMGVMEYLFENFNFPADQSFTIRRDELLIKKYTFLKCHENYEIALMENCMGKRFIGDNVADFEGPDLLLLGSYVPHCWQFYREQDPAAKPTAVVLHFFPDFMGKDFLQKPEARNIHKLFEQAHRGILFQGDIIPPAKTLLQQLFNSSGLQRISLMLQLLDLLSACKEYKVLSTDGFNTVSNSSDAEKINKVYDYVLKNFKTGVDLNQASALLNLSPAAFCRFFKQKTGRTLFDYVIELRIGYATKLLLEKQFSISEVCYKSGYNNLSTFNKQFKAVKNISPRSFLALYKDY